METMTIAQALSGLSIALFCAVATVFLVAIATLFIGVIVLGFLHTGRYLHAMISGIATVTAKKEKAPVKKLAKEGAK